MYEYFHCHDVSRFTSYFVEGNYSPDEQSKLVHQFVKVQHFVVMFSSVIIYDTHVVSDGPNYHSSTVVIRGEGGH